MSLLPEQSRAARGLLNWSRARLAEAAGVPQATLAEFESGKRMPLAPTLDDIRRAFEKAGVEFTNGDAPGVRFRPGPGEFLRADQLTSENDG